MNEGWVKIYRKICKWEWYKDLNTFKVFIHLLLNANIENSNFRGLEIKRGSLITGRKKISEESGVSEQSVRTSLNRLKSTNEITIETTKDYSIISINNYNEYQMTNQTTNQQLTNDQPTTNQQLTTIKEYKNNNSSNSSIKERTRIYQFYEENFGRLITTVEKEGLDYWLEEFKDEEIIKYGIKNAILSNIKNYKYIEGTFRNWKTNNFKTLEECKQKEIKVEDNPEEEIFEYDWLNEGEE